MKYLTDFRKTVEIGVDPGLVSNLPICTLLRWFLRGRIQFWQEYVVVQFYLWFKFYFPLIQTHLKAPPLYPSKKIYKGEDPNLTRICRGSVLSLVQILFSFDSNSSYILPNQNQRKIIFKARTKLNHNIYSLHTSEWECFCILDSPTIWYECHNVKCTKTVHVQCNCHSQLGRWYYRIYANNRPTSN